MPFPSGSAFVNRQYQPLYFLDHSLTSSRGRFLILKHPLKPQGLSLCLQLSPQAWPSSSRQPKVSRTITSRSSEDGSPGEITVPEEFKAFARTPIFKYWLQGAVFLVVLAGVDAAYSGDWSRIGVISKEFEDTLKPLVLALGAFHIACAIIAGRAAASKNISIVPAVLKVFAVGFLAMVEVLAAEPKSAEQ